MKASHKVVIGFISPGLVDSMFALRLAGIYRERPRVVDLMTDENSGLLSRGRNLVAANFLDHPAKPDWLLMLDTDMQLDLDAFDKLIDAAHDTERPVVAGLYFGAWGGQFYPAPVPLLFVEHPQNPGRYIPIERYPRDTVIQIDSAGTGCLLVHRSVFERIAEKAGPHEIAHFTDGTSQVRWCWFRDMPRIGDWFSEDHFFCARIREVGFPIHAHTGAVLAHRKRYWLDERHHLMNHPDMLTDEEKRAPLWSALSEAFEAAEAVEHRETTEAKDERETTALERPARTKPQLVPVPNREQRRRRA